jgi:ring-1,2-phenylacetyl-CoA epoxidase subunit PaaC
VTHLLRDALARYLLAVADDELVLGYRATEWTGVAPTLEEDIAMSSIGQDEVGHARLFYILLHDLTGVTADYRARDAHDYLHAQFLEHGCTPRYNPEGAHAGGGDWAFAIARQYLYDRFEAERLAALAGSAWAPVAQAVEKVRREEKYHLQHGQLWIDRLATAGGDARERLVRVLARAWPGALGLCESVEGDDALAAAGGLGATSAQLRNRWLDAIHPTFARYDLPFPARRTSTGGWELILEPSVGGRRRRHTAHWRQMWDEMTSVYRLDPQATW